MQTVNLVNFLFFYYYLYIAIIIIYILAYNI